jgi:hypothetical protein
MTEVQHATTEEDELPLADRLNKIGEEQSIPRNDGENDADYAERMVYELDVAVEELWAVQDSIREIVAAE